MPTPHLESLFGNLFNDIHYSDDHFSDYVEKEMELKAAGNTGGRFDAMLADTATLKVIFDTKRGVESSDLVHQLTGTKGENMAITSCLEFLREKDSYLKTKLLTKPLVYNDMMPRGMSEYTHADKNEIYVLLLRYRDQAVVHTLDLDAPFIIACNGMLATYEDAHTIHLDSTGDESDAMVALRTARTNLELQEMSNLRGTADIFPGDIASCLLYSPFNELKSEPQHAHIKKPGTLTPGEKAFVLTGVWAENMRIRLAAMTGDLVGGSISIALVEHETDAMPLMAKKVKNPKTNSFTPAQLQVSPTAGCLIVKSNNITEIAMYMVEIYYVNE